jgi:hypothetical protein
VHVIEHERHRRVDGPPLDQATAPAGRRAVSDVIDNHHPLPPTDSRAGPVPGKGYAP